MDKMRLRYTGGKSVSKIYFNRIRYIFNKENNFIADVPVGAWTFVKETNEFIPAPIEEKSVEISDDAPTVETATAEKPNKKSGWICDVCGFKAKSKSGAMAHKRIKHKEGK